MTTYVIEEGIPCPPPRRSKTGAPRSAQTPWTRLIDRLEPGQSVLTDQWSEYKSADQFRVRRPERTYVIRKVPRQGWRIWRTR